MIMRWKVDVVADDLAERRKAMADALFADLDRLRLQMFAPCVEAKALSVSDGKDAGSHVEIVEIPLDEPTFAAKRLIVAALGEGIDKVLQLAGSDASVDYDDWTAPAGTTPIRDTTGSESRDVRAPGGRGRKKAGARADAAPAARVGRRA